MKESLPTRRHIIEGEIVTGRALTEYERLLGFDRESLRDCTVLNFGSGGSHLGADLEKAGVPAFVVDIDLAYDPYEKTGKIRDIFKNIVTSCVSGLADAFKQHERPRNFLQSLKRKIAGIEDRNIVQGDGRFMPFKDRAFDRVLALWSTYQIPSQSKWRVLKELLRVGNIISIGPIFLEDFRIITELAEKMDFLVLECQPFSEKGWQSYEGTGMIVPPTRESPEIKEVAGTVFHVKSDGGSRITLKRTVPQKSK